MKILFITQKVDRRDDILGVYHEWIKALASRCERLSVVCLYQGDTELPENAFVYSLGKEKYAGSLFRRLIYFIRFYVALFKFRREYDHVFVHMNKEHVLLGAPIWKLCKIPVAFWYNHPYADWAARFAFKLADTVFYTSPFAVSAQLRKATRMPVGIIVPSALPSSHPRRGVVVSLGRISEVKNIIPLIEAVREMAVPVNLDIVGAPVDRIEDQNYFEKVKECARTMGDRVRFFPSVPNSEVGAIFQSADLSVNLTTVGSMDKTIFESMAAGCPPVISNPAVRDMLPEKAQKILFVDSKNPHDIANKIEKVLSLPESEYLALRRDLFEISKKESLGVLMEKLVSFFKRSVSKA